MTITQAKDRMRSVLISRLYTERRTYHLFFEIVKEVSSDLEAAIRLFCDGLMAYADKWLAGKETVTDLDVSHVISGYFAMTAFKAGVTDAQVDAILTAEKELASVKAANAQDKLSSTTPTLIESAASSEEEPVSHRTKKMKRSTSSFYDLNLLGEVALTAAAAADDDNERVRSCMTTP